MHDLDQLAQGVVDALVGAHRSCRQLHSQQLCRQLGIGASVPVTTLRDGQWQTRQQALRGLINRHGIQPRRLQLQLRCRVQDAGTDHQGQPRLWLELDRMAATHQLLIQADIDTRCRLRMWFDHCLLRDVSIALEED